MEILQTSTRVSDDRWKWSLSLQASDEELDSIEKVIYNLHPTFPNPIIEKTNRGENFAIHTSGWGTFVVRVEVHYKDKRIEELRHRLVFKRDKPKVFLSYSSTQEPELLGRITAEADRLGWEISTANDLAPGDDLVYGINQQIEEAQLFVLLGGETPSRWVMDEYQTAKQLGKKALVLDTSNHYSIGDNQKLTSSDELVNAFKAFNFELKGV